jgi:hypothetical protein
MVDFSKIGKLMLKKVLLKTSILIVGQKYFYYSSLLIAPNYVKVFLLVF